MTRRPPPAARRPVRFPSGSGGPEGAGARCRPGPAQTAVTRGGAEEETG
ncbi:hypothetical protein HDA36_005724 [Nocardiopsis composta]|uniref:Uncharacterized protein n=1 Tax=Nocardiopsis composta TaxID=157465 RepID=A0A7W8QTX4_9ACTN|nr:hypothetical protein [Nocardiopsis composta]